MLEVNLLGKTHYNVFALVMDRHLVRRPAVVLHPDLVDDICGARMRNVCDICAMSYATYAAYVICGMFFLAFDKAALPLGECRIYV